MTLTQKNVPLWLILIWIQSTNTKPEAGFAQLAVNISHTADNLNPSGFASIFSPRMDFDQWKPLTGRGDPLRNDPTYDYEPPVLEKVHYWADDTHIEREKIPERKSEVLVLGVSSRKPSVAPRPLVPPRRHSRPPTFPLKYEDFSYRFGDNFPMTILVPPPPPPVGHKPSLFVLSQDKLLMPTPHSNPVANPTLVTKDTTAIPELITSYALQEANLIYQMSTLKQNWLNEYNKTTNLPNNTVSSDYAGWGPTTPFEDTNDSHNLISYKDQQNIEFTKEPLFYYKPVLSESPPPLQAPSTPFILPPFLPTVLPPTHSGQINTEVTWLPTETTEETVTESVNNINETTTERIVTKSLDFTSEIGSKPKPNIIDMLAPMISMPMVTDPDRPEDHLYAHASDTIQIFKEPITEDRINIEILQTMRPPPPGQYLQNTTPQLITQLNVNPHFLNNLLHEKPVMHTHDPYLHMRFTTPMSVTVAPSKEIRTTTEAQSLPSYLIIQGHSKVKTYSSKPKLIGTTNNEIPKPNETTEVKHLHPIKDKYAKKPEKTNKNREGRQQNLKSLIDNGLGSIEIQETDVGIKYDVSDGSKVPVEIYKKGIVDNDENDYSKLHKKVNRKKRQIDFKYLLLLENNSLEDLIYNFINSKKNKAGFSDFIAEAITNYSNSAENDNDTEDDKYR